MKLIKTSAVALASLALTIASSSGQGLTLNFAAMTNADIQFNGNSDSFQFVANATGYQWRITSETNGSSALGLLGSFNGGPFSYGPISSTGSGLILVQQAPVTGPLANLVINDGSGTLNGNVNFENIETFASALGVLNATLSVNLTNVIYTGLNPDLQYLTVNQPGTLTLSFQFDLGKTLSQLSTGSGPYDTSFSGSITVTPEPGTLTLAGLGGLALLLLRRRK